MTDAEIIYRAMILMVRANARARIDQRTGQWQLRPTERLRWRKVRIDYYPMSCTHSWFGRDGLPNKPAVLAAINDSLK